MCQCFHFLSFTALSSGLTGGSRYCSLPCWQGSLESHSREPWYCSETPSASACSSQPAGMWCSPVTKLYIPPPQRHSSFLPLFHRDIPFPPSLQPDKHFCLPHTTSKLTNPAVSTSILCPMLCLILGRASSWGDFSWKVFSKPLLQAFLFHNPCTQFLPQNPTATELQPTQSGQDTWAQPAGFYSLSSRELAGAEAALQHLSCAPLGSGL